MLMKVTRFLNNYRNVAFRNLKRTLTTNDDRDFDVVVIGGGAMGASSAYWLKQMCPADNFNVLVIEKDFTYSRCSTVLSVGGIRQQFSLKENIQMSLFGAEFLETLKQRFGPEADVAYTRNGYLVLASEEGADELETSFNLQIELGADKKLLTKNQLKEQFPWMNVSDVELGCFGVDKEGWFDPYALLNLFKASATKLGARFVHGDAVAFETDKENESVRKVLVKLPNGDFENFSFRHCVLAAGAESGDLAKLMKIGLDEDMETPLPVERRKRYVYRFDCQDANPPGTNSPLLIDYTGAYFRRDGNCYIGGQSPLAEEEPETNDLEVDFTFFDEKVWPALADRIPAFNNIKVRSAWAGFYEYNTFDENGIIGPHDLFKNLYFATGFSGHGIQQAPAVGRAISELILRGRFETLNLERLGFQRFRTNQPMYEVGIY